MQKLPLYRDKRALVERNGGLNRNVQCQRCGRHRDAQTICVAAEGKPGGLLAVGEMPGKEEDKQGRPFVGGSGRYLRGLLKKGWDGPVVLHNAVGCAGKSAELDEIVACRGYLGQVLAESEPTRVLALGRAAVASILGTMEDGQTYPVMAMRRGYGFLSDGTPVFTLTNPAHALRNRFYKTAFEADLKWALQAEPPFEPAWGGHLMMVETGADAHIAEIDLAAEGFAWDVETVGVLFEPGFRIVSVAAAPYGRDYAYVWSEAALRDPAVSAPLFDGLRNPEISKTEQNGKFERKAAWCAWKLEVGGASSDTMLKRRLLEPKGKTAALSITAALVGMVGHKAEAQAAEQAAAKKVHQARAKSSKGDGLQQGLFSSAEQDDTLALAVKHPDAPVKSFTMGLIPKEILYRYNALDAISTNRLDVHLDGQLEASPPLSTTWDEIYEALTPAVFEMERWGVWVDKDAHELADRWFTDEIERMTEKLATYGDFNPDSGQDVVRFLYTEQGIVCPKYTEKQNPSVDAEALSMLAAEHPIAIDLVEYRHLTKLHGTYVKPLYSHLREDGRLHPTFNLGGTESSRLSCKDPNVQQIPRTDTEAGKMVKGMYAAPPGWQLMQFDYGQVELRTAAMLSGDKAMIELYQQGVDVHRRTAAQVWEISEAKVSKSQRSIAKIIVFASLYGAGPGQIVAQLAADGLHISVAQARKIQAAIFAAFPELHRWIQSQVKYTRREGICWTMWNGARARHRPLWEIADQAEDSKLRGVAERSSYNTPIQGSASYFTLASIPKVVDWAKAAVDRRGPWARVPLTVHDQMMLEIRDDKVAEAAAAVPALMTQWPTPHNVPLKVDVEKGPTWGSLQPYSAAA